MKKEKENLAITLFKQKVRSVQECLSEYPVDKRFDIKPEFNLEGQVIIGVQNSKTPEWVNFLQRGVEDALPNLENLSSRAAIIVKIKNRFIGISFGYGQVLFDKSKIEKNFGLKTVINSVDPDNLRSFNSAKLDDNTIITRKQASRGSKKSAFGPDLPTELLCGVSGKCLEPILGTQIAGKDQLLISPKVDFTNLKEILETALAQYFKKDYQKNFAWFDNIQVENDMEKCKQLCTNLTKDLQSGRFELFSLACPDIYDPEKIEGFSFTSKGELHPDLYFDEFVTYLKASKTTSVISAGDFKNHKILAKDAQEEEVEKWSAFDCLNYETELKGERYLLFKGDWYHIKKSYFTDLTSYFQDKTIAVYLEEHLKGEGEDEYSKKIGKQSDCVCLDRENIRLKNSDPVEPCDVFTGNREFLHIKKKYGSAALSHLFAQGKVSGELLKVSGEFRKKLRDKINKIGGGKVSHDLVPPPSDKVKPEDFKIIFGVIDEKAGNELKLPFFSLINFQSTGQQLEALGFEVGITKIRCKAA